MQQTQIKQGLPYYVKISAAYPTVKHLADAGLSELMKLWEGLGYYSRARHLHQTAKFIAYEKNGIFPNTYTELLKLKGVGTYTAAAIASFAFDQPYAVVDGNVFRVLARVFGIKKPIDSTEGKKYFTQFANSLIDIKRPADYNQAIMDFGATVCTPKHPLCNNCPFNKSCVAKKTNSIGLLPVKLKKLTKKNRYFNYLFITYKNKIYLHQRLGKDIWKNLYDLPLIESPDFSKKNKLQNAREWKLLFKGLKPKIKSKSTQFVQQLSHQTIYAYFYNINITKPLEVRNEFIKISKNELNNYAFPKIIRDYLKTIANFKY